MAKQGLADATYGYEYETSDVNLLKAAEFVFGHQGIPVEEWKDRGKTSISKIRRFDIYNISSDGAVWNNDGTKSMKTVMLNGEIVKMTPELKHLDKCAELISPVLKYANLENDMVDLEFYLNKMQELGGTVSPWCWNDFNIHVGVEGWELGDVKKFITWLVDVQDIFTEFRDPFNALEHHSPRRYRLPKVTYDLMMQAETKAEMWHAYRTMQHPRSLKVPSYNDFWKRSMISFGSWLNDDVPHNTAEWRMWPMTTDVSILKELIQVSVEWTYAPPPKSEVRDWMDDILPRAKATRPRRPDWSKAPVEEKFREENKK